MGKRTESNQIEMYAGGHYGLNHAALPEDLNITVEEGNGYRLTTKSGDEYIDYILGSGPIICGHSHPSITKAIQEQAKKGTTFILSNEPAISLGEKIVDAVPCADKMIYTCTGSQAVYYATRIARAYTEKNKILKFEGAYHGYHDSVLKSTNRADADELAENDYPNGTQDSAGILSSTSEQTLVAPFNDLNRTQEIVREHANDLAAILVEPIQRSIPPSEGFLSGLRNICHDNDVLLIFDEVVTGFRLAWGGAQERYGVEPDLATYGKTITGGTPMGAVCGSGEIMKLTDPRIEAEDGGCYVSSTLNANPLCATAGIAALEVLEQPGTYDHLNWYAEEFRDLIDDVLEDASLAGTALGDGPIVDYTLTDEKDVSDWRKVANSDIETKKSIDRAMIEHGILSKHGGRRYISISHDETALRKTAEAFKSAVEEVR